MQFSITFVSSRFNSVSMRSPNFRNGVTWSYTWCKAHFSCLCFTAAITGQVNSWSIKNKTKWFSNKLNIRIALKINHITLEITRGYIYVHGFRLFSKTAIFQFPRKNWKLPQNTNMFFQPMSDIYTLIMRFLARSWFEIMEFSQILIISAFWH